MSPINLSKLTPSGLIKGDDEQDTHLLKTMLGEAQKFLMSFPWCGEVLDSYLGIGVGGVVAVFYFQIKPNSDDADEWLWAVVGDIPPAYIAVDRAPNAACALDAYIGAMEEWVNAVNNGISVDDLIPVNVSPTRENADRLKSRLAFIDTKILSNYSDDLRGS